MPQYRFGAFELDSEARVLRRNGEATPITGRPFDVLIMLVQNRGRLIDKDELLSQIWAGSAVEESNLAHCIFSLRKVLGDSPKDHHYIATIAGRGYQFVAPVTELTNNWQASEGARKKSRPFWGRSLLLQFGVAAALFLTFVLVHRSLEHAAGRGLPEPRLSHLTSYPGTETMPAFSPDGKQIAYVRARHQPLKFVQQQMGQASIYTKLIGASTELRLTGHPGADYYPAWSPDGQYVAFYRDEPGASGLYVVSALGGQDRRISEVKVGDGGIAWLHDGHRLVISQFSESSRCSPLVEVFLDTGRQRSITSPPPEAMGDAWPAISPDGKTLAFLRFTNSEGVHACFMPSTGEGPVRCSPLQLSWPEGLTWAGSNNGIVISAIREGGHRLWRYEGQDAPLVPLTAGEEDALFPAVSPEGNRLVYTSSRFNTNIWELDLSSFETGTPRTAKPVAPSTRMQVDPSISPDGRKIAFMSDQSGSEEIWVADRATQSSTQLTHFAGQPAGSPNWSPDGAQIAFDSGHDTRTNIFVVSSDGGNPRQITNTPSAENCCPFWSRGGQFIYFASNRSGRFQIWKAFAGTGETPLKPAEQITRGGGFRASESADGRYLYYVKGRGEHGLWRRALTPEGKEESVLDSLQEWGWWALGPKTIYFFDRPPYANSRVRLNGLNVADRSVRELAELPQPVVRETPAIAASGDGRYVAYVQIDSMEADIMLVENFR